MASPVKQMQLCFPTSLNFQETLAKKNWPDWRSLGNWETAPEPKSELSVRFIEKVKP